MAAAFRGGQSVKAKRYAQVFDGQFHEIKTNPWKMRCCDCGLVHVIRFKFKDKVFGLVATRDNRATGQTRRKRRKRAL